MPILVHIGTSKTKYKIVLEKTTVMTDDAHILLRYDLHLWSETQYVTQRDLCPSIDKENECNCTDSNGDTCN